MPWFVYILKCNDKTLYTGITNDLPKRLAAHASGTGAKYTRGRGPLKITHTERYRSKGQALKREAAIKSLTRAEKLILLSKKGAQ